MQLVKLLIFAATAALLSPALAEETAPRVLVHFPNSLADWKRGRIYWCDPTACGSGCCKDQLNCMSQADLDKNAKTAGYVCPFKRVGDFPCINDHHCPSKYICGNHEAITLSKNSQTAHTCVRRKFYESQTYGIVAGVLVVFSLGIKLIMKFKKKMLADQAAEEQELAQL